MTCDVLFLSHNRLAFTRKTLRTLINHTDWTLIRRLVIYDDWSTDGSHAYLKNNVTLRTELRLTAYGSPVAVMLDYLTHDPADWVAKIDNDTMVPFGWLNECMAVVHKHPELDLLGIEAMKPVTPGHAERSYSRADFVGGIGLFRTAAFKARKPMEPQGRFGFTAWQDQNPDVIKGWLNPALPVCLLDRVPFEPWVTLSNEYVRRGWQREWEKYDERHRALWEWWK